jgi:hypothetical protein
MEGGDAKKIKDELRLGKYFFLTGLSKGKWGQGGGRRIFLFLL